MLQITNGAVQARARVLVVAFLAQEEPYGRRTALNASIYSRSYGRPTLWVAAQNMMI